MCYINSGGCGYLKMKIEIIFEIPTIETPKLIQHMIFGGIGLNPLLGSLPSPGGALAGIGGSPELT